MGLISFSLSPSTYGQIFPSKSLWGFDSIPDLEGKVVIVTGGYSGIGKVVVRECLKHNATVYILGRNPVQAQATIEELKSSTGKEAKFITLDLADLNTIRKAVDEFKSKENQLHILFHNAGIMVPPMSQLTTQGYDLQFGVNCIGPFLMTKLLLPTLSETAKSSGQKVRIVNYASVIQGIHDYIDYDSLYDGPKRKSKINFFLYGQSKTAVVLFSNEVAKRYADQNIVSICLNPGLGRYTNPFQSFFYKLVGYDADHGALSPLFAGTAPEAEDMNGKYLIPWARLGKAMLSDAKGGEKLWDWLEEKTKEF